MKRSLPILQRAAASIHTHPAYPGHVPITPLSRLLLATGSAITSLVHPARHGPSLLSSSPPSHPPLTNIPSLDMIAVLSETTAGPFLPRLRDRMLESRSGRNLLRERPRITEKSVDLVRLEGMREGSLGREYVEWLRRNRVTPDTRDPVRSCSALCLLYQLGGELSLTDDDTILRCHRSGISMIPS